MNRTRLLLVLTMTTLIVGLAACSGNSGDPEPTAIPASNATSIPTEAPTQAPTPTPTSIPEPTPGPGTLPTEIVSPPQEEPDRPARRDDGSLGVVFRVTVPPGTPPESTILMTGDRPALGSGVVMKPLETDPLVYEGVVVFGHDGTLNYRFELLGGEAVSGPKRVETDFDGQVVNDLIESWSVVQ